MRVTIDNVAKDFKMPMKPRHGPVRTEESPPNRTSSYSCFRKCGRRFKNRINAEKHFCWSLRETQIYTRVHVG
jgi:hypothetical protein